MEAVAANASARLEPPLFSTVWRQEKLGLLMILSFFIAMSIVVSMILHYQQSQLDDATRTQGVKLISLIADMDYSRLVEKRSRGVLQLILDSQGYHSDIAYAAVVKPQGQVLSFAAAPSVIIPPMIMPLEPANWRGTHELTIDSSDNTVREFYAPILQDGELKAFIRLGYFQQYDFLTPSKLSFIASIMLPIFLLTALFYFLMRREVSPLKIISQNFDQADPSPISLMSNEVSGELSDFIQHFNDFILRQSHKVVEKDKKLLYMEAATKVLAYNRGRLESALQALPEALVILDNNGTVSFANNKLQSLLEIEPSRIIGEPHKAWCDDPELINYISKSIQGGIASRSLDKLEIISKGEFKRPISVRIFPLSDPKNPKRSNGNVIVFSDNSEQQLAKNSRAEFVGHVSHELKTPLNTIALYSETLLQEDLSHSMQVESANVINSEVSRLAGLIDNLLSITKIETGSLGIERQRVKLTDLLQDCFNAIQQLSKNSGLHFVYEVPKEISPVALDKNLIRIAINNLLTNAVKYNNPEGEVVLSLEELDDCIRICVKDSGIGINYDDQQKIFEKFYRSQEDNVQQRSGHGLGLALSKDIIDLHHGRMWVESKANEGSMFFIELNKESELLKYVDI